MRPRKSGQTGEASASDQSNEANRRNRPKHGADTDVLWQLSPAAIAHWPTVAQQLSDAGVLSSVDARSVVSYCEAFARWRAVGDELAKMLIEFGAKSVRQVEEEHNGPQGPEPQAAITPMKPANPRPPAAIMRRVEVERETGLSRSTIYQRVKEGTFPPQLKIGPRSIGWRVADIESFLKSPANYRAEDKKP
ncbi:AlpA family phage regulatory protein [Paraburkholderia caribensis]|uniref:AlpA family phage regulatory protein n=1 Tax=Paraburkholderia caribensis TaxID=75105 RepID=UPI000A475576|nr:AlpA family phage regulatory protein [Paraburkholderia caribensis]